MYEPKKAVYLRAQEAILLSSVVSVREKVKILQKARAGWRSGQVHKTFMTSQEVVDHQSLTVPQRKLVIKKAKHKRGNSTRKISEQLKNIKLVNLHD